MADKDPTNALVVVVKALEPLSDPDRQWVLKSAASRWNLSVPTTAIAPPISPGLGIGVLVGPTADVQTACRGLEFSLGTRRIAERALPAGRSMDESGAFRCRGPSSQRTPCILVIFASRLTC